MKTYASVVVKDWARAEWRTVARTAKSARKKRMAEEGARAEGEGVVCRGEVVVVDGVDGVVVVVERSVRVKARERRSAAG